MDAEQIAAHAARAVAVSTWQLRDTLAADVTVITSQLPDGAYETLVKAPDEIIVALRGDSEQAHYTRRDAEVGHHAMCARLNALLFVRRGVA